MPGVRFSSRPAKKVENDESPKTPLRSEDDHAPAQRDAASRRFVILTKDFTALGWADGLDRQGEEVYVATDYENEDEPEQRKRMEKVGDGWLQVLTVDEALKTLQSPNTYWIFGENCFPEAAKTLLDTGQKVFPKSIELGEQMEHERDLGVDIATDAGLTPPKTYEFSDRDDALSIMEQHPDQAFVLKLNDNKFNYMTLVPVRKEDADAHEEVENYLKYMEGECGDGILQERIKIEDALEVCVELWYYEGRAFMATCGLEVKRKNTYDIGEMCGCGGDFAFVIPMDCQLVKLTMAKMDSFYQEQKYTGLADMNVIFTPDDKPHFLEVCNRFGYNFHPDLFLALGKDTFGNIIADYVDGYVETIPDRFDQENIGCSLTLFLDHPREGLPVHVDTLREDSFYPFDGFKKNTQLLLTGYSDEVGIFVGKGESIESAWKNVSEAIAFDEAVSFPDMYYRWDLAEDNYYNAPVLRYNELKKRGLIP